MKNKIDTTNWFLIQPELGNIIQIYSDTWYVYTSKGWKEMTVDEQLEYSRLFD